MGEILSIAYYQININQTNKYFIIKSLLGLIIYMITKIFLICIYFCLQFS